MTSLQCYLKFSAGFIRHAIISIQMAGAALAGMLRNRSRSSSALHANNVANLYGTAKDD
jgi:hypothetical protein